MSFLESKVQSRYNDATRAEVERKLKLEHAKLNEVKILKIFHLGYNCQ